jgi:hypothetical protein
MIGGMGETDTTGDAWQAAIDYGIDMSQLEITAALSPYERLIRHDRALVLVRAMRAAGIEYYGYDPQHPRTAGGE